MLLLHLVLGVVLVALSILPTRGLARRLSPDAEAARRWELRAWGFYLALAALIYVGWAQREPGHDWLPVELAGLAAFSLLGALGGLRWPLLLAAGWALHGGWDALLHAEVPDGFVPTWYRRACLSYDLVAAAWLARLARG